MLIPASLIFNPLSYPGDPVLNNLQGQPSLGNPSAALLASMSLPGSEPSDAAWGSDLQGLGNNGQPVPLGSLTIPNVLGHGIPDIVDRIGTYLVPIPASQQSTAWQLSAPSYAMAALPPLGVGTPLPSLGPIGSPQQPTGPVGAAAPADATAAPGAANAPQANDGSYDCSQGFTFSHLGASSKCLLEQSGLVILGVLIVTLGAAALVFFNKPGS